MDGVLSFDEVVAKMNELLRGMDGEALAALWNANFDGKLTYDGEDEFTLNVEYE